MPLLEKSSSEFFGRFSHALLGKPAVEPFFNGLLNIQPQPTETRGRRRIPTKESAK